MGGWDSALQQGLAGSACSGLRGKRCKVQSSPSMCGRPTRLAVEKASCWGSHLSVWEAGVCRHHIMIM